MRTMTLAASGVVLLVTILQCCPSTVPLGEPLSPEPTAFSSPTDQPTPTPTPTEALQAPTRTPRVKPDLTRIAARYPRVDGSTSTHPLQVLLACEILGVPCVWQEDLLGGTKRIAPELTYVGSPESVEMIFGIQHNGTHGSYVNLIEGNADLILVARRPSKDELNAAKDNGVALDVTPVALDAFVFLLNVKNPVHDLTIETVKDIYTGRMKKWAEVAAPGELGGDIKGEIHAYQRNPNSGSQELMETLVMKGEPMIDAPDMILETMMGPVNAIAEDPTGIGYSVYYYVMFIFPDERVEPIGINGVEPTSDNIATRAYPLTTEVYAVVREDMPQDSTAVMLRNWLLTREGQGVIGESGYVPLR